jgi:hypothetical protein
MTDQIITRRYRIERNRDGGITRIYSENLNPESHQPSWQLLWTQNQSWRYRGINYLDVDKLLLQLLHGCR